ncbi:MAG: Low affinity NH4+ transporter [Pycnora praestabilis]|nr:MAG: Low affinity NH4+ transporter [Pycnora praestabilis]
MPFSIQVSIGRSPRPVSTNTDGSLYTQSTDIKPGNQLDVDEQFYDAASFHSQSNIVHDMEQQPADSDKPGESDGQHGGAAGGPGHHPSAPPISLPHEIAFIAIVTMAQFITQAGLGQAIAPLHIIGNSFGTTDEGELSWYAAAYSLTVGTFILIAGRLGDIYGHKKLFVIGFTWFGLWSLLAGFSVYSTQIFFDICRAFQGIGPALLLPNAMAILGRTYPPGKRKDMIFSIFGATAPGGFVVGAVFSSIFAEYVWWPWGYWVMAMVCWSLAAMAVFVIPSPPAHDKPPTQKGELDLAGAATGVTGLVLINFAWNQGPVVGWATPYTYALLIVGFIFLVAFFFIETRVAHPLVPLHKLTKEVAFVLACIAAGWSSFGIWVFYLWQFLQLLRGQSALQTAAQCVPCAISGCLAAITTGFLLSKMAPGYIMFCAMVAFCVGTILLATAPVAQIYWAQVFISTIVMPWGMDMSFPSATIIMSNSMPRGSQGVAASLVATVVNYSISLGLGFAGTIQTRLNHQGTDLLRGFRSAWYMGIGLSGLGILISIYFVIDTQLEKRRQQRTMDQRTKPGAVMLSML